MIRIVLGVMLALFGLLCVLAVAANPNAYKGSHGEPAAVAAALVFLGLFVVPGALLICFGQRARRRSKRAARTPTPALAHGPVEQHPATTGTESISLLIPRLRSGDVDARAAAAEQLGQLADPAAVQPLVDLMHEESLRILRGTLGLYGGVFSVQRGPLPIPATDVGEHERLIKARVRRKAADALCRIGAPAVPALIQMLEDPDERFLMVREEAARVLGELKAAEALPALTAVLPSGGDLAALARAALEHIGRQDADRPKQKIAPVRPSAPTAITPALAETLGNDKIERLLAGLKEYDDTLQALLRGLELGYARSVLNTDLEYLAHLDLGHMLVGIFDMKDRQQLARLHPLLQSIHSGAEAAGKFIEGGARIPTSAQEIVDTAMRVSQTSTPYPPDLYMIIPNILMVTQSCLGHVMNILGPVTPAPWTENPPQPAQTASDKPFPAIPSPKKSPAHAVAAEGARQAPVAEVPRTPAKRQITAGMRFKRFGICLLLAFLCAIVGAATTGSAKTISGLMVWPFLLSLLVGIYQLGAAVVALIRRSG